MRSSTSSPGSRTWPSTARALAAVSLLASATTAHAAKPPPRCDSTDSCLTAVEGAQRGTKSLSARFVQTKHVALLEEPIVSTGRLLFLRPDRVRLDLEEPRTGTIIVDGDRIEIPGLPQSDREAMTEAPVGRILAQLGALLAGSAKQLAPTFRVTARNDGDAVVVSLDPRTDAWRKLYRRIAIRFAGAALEPSGIELEDALGDRLDIRLTQVERNVPVSPDAFRGAASSGS